MRRHFHRHKNKRRSKKVIGILLGIIGLLIIINVMSTRFLLILVSILRFVFVLVGISLMVIGGLLYMK